MDKNNKEIIYVSYDGILEPLGESQVLKYLSNLKYKNKIILLSFEKKNNLLKKNSLKRINKIAKSSDIDWVSLKYTSNLWLLSKIIDILKINYFIFKNFINHKIKIIHCRSYLPVFSVIFFKFFFKFNLIFDMRGFWIDERYEWNIWKKYYFIYYFLKRIENFLIKYSDIIVVLSKDAKKEIIHYYNKSSKKIFVIPTCADENQFKLINEKKNNNNKLRLCHLGTIKTRYDINLTLNFLKLINKKIPSSLTFINKYEKDYIIYNCSKYNIDVSQIEIISLDHNQIQDKINKFDFNIFFPKKGYYLKGFFPTKIAESLMSGIPIITTSINTEINNHMTNQNIGIIIDHLNDDSIDKIFKNINFYRNIKNKRNIREFAINNLSIKYAISIYNMIYKNSLQK